MTCRDCDSPAAGVHLCIPCMEKRATDDDNWFSHLLTEIGHVSDKKHDKPKAAKKRTSWED